MGTLEDRNGLQLRPLVGAHPGMGVQRGQQQSQSLALKDPLLGWGPGARPGSPPVLELEPSGPRVVTFPGEMGSVQGSQARGSASPALQVATGSAQGCRLLGTADVPRGL